MKALTPYSFLLALALAGALTGCATQSTKAADVTDSVRASLDTAGFKDVSVKEDQAKGVVTLGGHVTQDADKAQAESIAKSLAGAQVVSNQIEVIPVGVESDAKKVNSDLDKAIEHNLDAALIQAKLHDNVKYSVKNHVVTLSGEVTSQAARTQAQDLAAAVLNVQQVVNELQVKAQKASSTK